MLQELNSDRKPNQIKGIALDIDNTLTLDFFSWSNFTQTLLQEAVSPQNGAYPQAKEIGHVFRQYKRVENPLSIEDAKLRWMHLWHVGGGLTRQKVRSISRQIAEDAISTRTLEAVRELKYFGLPIAIVSAAYREFVEEVANILDIEDYHYNPHFVYQHSSPKALATELAYNTNETDRKIRQVRYLAGKWKVPSSDIVVVDDKPHGLTSLFPVVSLNAREYPTDTWHVVDHFGQVPRVIMEHIANYSFLPMVN